MTRFYLLFLCLVLSPFALSAQITNAEVNYELYVDQWQQTCDNDNISSDDNEVKVGLTSDTNTGGTAAWTSGGNGATCTGNNYVRRWQADAPSTVTNTNTLLYRCTNRTNAANDFTINHESWEEDGSADCSRSGDACQSSGTWVVTFKSAAKTPNRFWSYGGVANISELFTGQSGDFAPKTVWRYTNGASCGNALNFGTLASGTTYSHVNSNRPAPTGASADLGYVNVSGNASPDVFYQFVLSSPATVVISTINGTTNFDTYLRLYNSTACGTQIAFNDDFGSAQSQITRQLCAGTYVIQVEGFNFSTGDFALSVLATDLPIAGGTIAGGTSPSCVGTDPGAFTSSNDGSGVSALSYQWEQSIISGATGFGDIGGATGTTYDIPVLSQQTWFRRRITDACGRVAYSNVIQISMNTLSTVPTTISGTTSICEFVGSTTLTASGGTAGTGATFEWFAGSCGGSAISNNASITVNPSTTTTYFVRRTGTCNTTTCISQTVTVNTNSSQPGSISASQSLLCTTGATSVLTANGGSLGSGANYVWYTAGCGTGAPIGTGASITVSPTSTTVYYVRIEGVCNTTTCASGTVSVHIPSTAPTIISGTTSICEFVGITTLTASGGTDGTGATFEWFVGSCGGTAISNNASITVNPSTTTTYFVRRRGSCNTTTCISQTVTVNTNSGGPSSMSATQSFICPGGSSVLTANGGSLGTGGSNYVWYAGACGSGAPVGTGASITVSPTSTTLYYVRIEGPCNTTTCASGTIFVRTPSTTPTAITGPTSTCGGFTTLTVSGGTVGDGATYFWYTNSCGGTPLANSTGISVNPATTTTYYARLEGTCNTTTCISATVTVGTASTAPTAIAGTTTICNGASTVLTQAGGALGSGAVYNWYTGSCGGTLVGTGSSITVSPAANTTYFVRAEGNCNTTGCASVAVTVNALSTAPTSITGTTTICNGSSTTLTQSGGALGTGGVYRWYSASCGGTLVGTGNSITVSPTANTTYFVRAEGTCNTTTCASVAVTVNALSTAPTSITGTTTICNGSSTTLTQSGGALGTGGVYRWYSASCGGTLVGTGNSITVSPAANTTYFVRAEGTCNTTGCASVAVTVNALSTAPTSITGTTTICNGSSTTLTQSGGALGTGGVYNWYTASCGGTLVGTGNSITVAPTANTTYFVRAEGTCNTTTCASVAVTVNAVSSAPTSITGTTTICNGGSTTLTQSGGALGTGGVYRWYSASCGGTLVGTGNSITVSPTANTTYFVRAEGTCNATACASVAVSVNILSTPLTINPVSPINCPNTTLTLSGTGGVEGTGAIAAWYTAPNGGGTLLGTGNSINVTPQATTTYYARREGTCNTTTDASVVVSVRDYVYAINNTSANTYCTDASGWHHFYTGSEIILSLQGDLSGVTNMTATIKTNPTYYQDRPSGASPFSCANGWTPGEERFEMPRNWNINYTGTLNGTYNVRYYYPPAERTAVETAAQNWAATYPACGYTYKYNPLSNGWFWFKNTSGNYVAPQFEALILAGGANGVAGAANYSTIMGVTSFSGGTGAVILVPDNRLPIELLSFTGYYTSNKVVLNWTTGSERNNSHFEVQRSRTGTANDFEYIGTIAGQGDSQSEQYYQLIDNQPHEGTNYYRLRQVDNDGTYTYSYIIAVQTPDDGKPYTFFPNPTATELTYQFISARPEAVKIEIMNALGQVLFVQSYTVGAGQQQILLDMSAYPDAAYIIRAYHAEGGEVVTETILKKQP